MLKSLEGTVIEQAFRLGFIASNIKTKYEALNVGLKKSRVLSVQNLIIHCDSQLITNQLTGEYAARNQRMEAYMRLAQKLFKSFNSAYIKRFSQTNNSHADTLVTFSSAVESDMKIIIEVEFLPRPTIDAEQDCHMVFDVEVDLGVS